MGIEFDINDEDQIIIIRLSGRISAAEVAEMRERTIELLRETGIRNFLLEMSAVSAILDQNTVSAYEAGKDFGKIEFPYSAKTAVIMPIKPSAHSQAEFLHTVELNRGRGLIEYVADYDEARRWFQSLSNR